MKRSSVLLLGSVLAAGSLMLGCGSSGDTTVIQPTEQYELTEQEAANKAEIEKAMDAAR